MKIRKDESGSILAIVAICLPILMGFAGLAMDVGLLFRAKRNLQVVADSAAVAAALDYLYNNSASSAQSAALASAAANGIVPATGGPHIAVNTPPSAGPNAGVAGFIEVIITDPSPTFFLGMISHSSSVGVTARAVAGAPGPSADCVYVLDPTASGAMTLQGSFDVDANHCGVVIDSLDPDALQFTGSGGTLIAGSVSVVGGDGGAIGDSTPTPITGSSPVSDPLENSYPSPAGGAANSECSSVDTATTTITGTIAGPGAGNSVCYTQPRTLNNVTLGNGIYVFENGVTLSGNIVSTVTSNGGATLEIESGSFNVNTGTVLGTALVPFTAPTMGPTNGIVLMEPLANKSQITIQKGDASGSLTGIIYAPGAQLYLQDSGGGLGLTITSDIIVDQLFDKTATININSYSASYPNSPLRAVTLVE
jgi:hypothetical protein